MPHRCALGCKNTDVVMHVFPNPDKFPERFKAWVDLVRERLEIPLDVEYFKNRRICDIHFIPEHRNRNKRLNALSIPILHLPDIPKSREIENSDDNQPSTSFAAADVIASGESVPQESENRGGDTQPDTSNIEATFIASAIEGVIAVDRALEVSFGDGKSIRFEDCWLRDHCRCSTCYHSNTFQRAYHILDIPDVTVLRFRNDKTNIAVTWSDDHKSSYTAEFLSKFDFKTWKESRKLRPILWHGGIEDKVPRVPVEEFLTSVEGAKRVFQSLLHFGVALVDGVGVSLKATEVVCKALGGVQHTIFGGMWQFTTRADHADTAYTNLPLAAHNDNTYFTEAAGLQILHCLEHKNGTGGETILVDGFYGATELKKESPEDFTFLSSFNLEAEYIEDGHHYTYSAPVIRVDCETEELVQIRFNVYDRAPMAFSSSEECRSYYRSLRSLAKNYQNESNQWRFKLRPGTVMIMDNFRILHGRTGFSGSRVLGGSYVSRSDWLNKARALGLIK